MTKITINEIVSYDIHKMYLFKDLQKGLIIGSLLFLFISLMIRLILFSSLRREGYYFEENMKLFYAAIRVISELFYALSIATMVIFMIFYITKADTTNIWGNIVIPMRNNTNILFITGTILLVLVSPIYRILFSCRNSVLEVFDIVIPLSALLIIFSSIIIDSVYYFS